MPQAKSATQTLCEPRQWTCIWTFHKSHFMQFTGKMPQALCEPALSKCTWTFHKSRCVREFTGKMLQISSATQAFCEPAQSTCTRTFHTSHFAQTTARRGPCASLRNRHALGGCTRAISMQNLQEKCWGPE